MSAFAVAIGVKRTSLIAAHMSACDPTLSNLSSGLSYHRSLREGGGHARPDIVEKHKNDGDNPAVHAARDQAIDGASNRQQRKIWKDRGQQVVAFKIGIDQLQHDAGHVDNLK